MSSTFHAFVVLVVAAMVIVVAAVAASVGSASIAEGAVAAIPGTMIPVNASRIADSRIDLQLQSAVKSTATALVQVEGKGGIPDSAVAAVVGTVTVTRSQAVGYLTVWPSGLARPDASVMNFQAGEDISATLLLQVGQDGKIAVFNGSPGSVDLIVDVTGYVPAGEGTVAGALVPVPPTRVADSRTGLQIPAAVAAAGTISLQIAGRGGIPADGVGAAVLNVIAANPVAAGHLTAWPSGIARTSTSMLNYRAGQNIGDSVVVPVGPDGKVQLYNGGSAPVDVIVDVAGYTLGGTPSIARTLATVTPDRIVDSRDGLQIPDALPAQGTAELQVTGLAEIPNSKVAAVVGTLTVVAPQAGGYLTAWSAGSSKPGIASMNFVAGQVIANTVVVAVGPDGSVGAGKIQLFNGSAGTVQVIFDVTGYTLAAPTGSPVTTTTTAAASTTAAATTAPTQSTTVYKAANFDNMSLGAVNPTAFNSALGSTNKNAAAYDDMSIVTDSRGGKVVRTKLAAGTIHSRPGSDNGDNLFIKLPTSYDKACVRYDLKFDSKFDWSLGGKLPGLEGVAPGVSPGTPTGGNVTELGWSGRMMWLGPKAYKWAGPTNMAVSYIYHPGQADKYGDNVRWNKPFLAGTWHTVKQCYVMNTVGKANGQLTAWMDGVQVVNNTAYTYRTRDDVHINYLIFVIFRGGNNLDWAGSHDDYVDIDNMSVTNR